MYTIKCNNYYRRNYIVPNQNFQPRYKRVNRNNGYPRNQYLYENNTRRSLEQTKFIRNPKTSRSTLRQRSQQQQEQRQPQQRQRRRNGPRQLQSNDFMPPQLRDKSPANIPNLPVDFNLTIFNTTATNTRSNIPMDALPQRSISTTQAIRTTNDTAQSFNVYDDLNENVNRQQPKQKKKKNNQLECQTTTMTTASYRRRQRRIRQQQYHNTNDRNDENFNRFSALEQNDASIDIESNYDEGDDETIDGSSRIEDNMTDYSEKEQMNKKNIKNKNDRKNKKKNDKNNKLRRRIYLETNRIMRYMQDNATVIASGRGNQAYILAAAPIYDEWIRNNYEF
ncbi:unnamed protein product [Rotaria magnacalcarata]|uniref:Uncharacterized protein n=5 Tax=Rotaria magnacalcarata TaxID=392030 RepID=A0A816P9B4_9BILA|nr:unnamed protein product [Rotaria magnacalcarata]